MNPTESITAPKANESIPYGVGCKPFAVGASIFKEMERLQPDGGYHCVYITTNLINGKQYVGDHTTKNLNDNYLGSGIYLINAIKKYGRHNFIFKILYLFPTRQKAHEAEIMYINKYNTLRPFGYNISPTGGVKNGGTHSEETKKTLTLKLTGNKNGEGVIFTKERCYKISEKLKGNTNALNCVRSEEYKHQKSITMVGNKNGLGFKHDKETLKRMCVFQQNRPIVVCPHCKKEGKKGSAMMQWHFDNCNENLNRIVTEDTIQKKKDRYNKISITLKKLPLITCPWCNSQSTNKQNMNRWHFDNCKKRKNEHTTVAE